MPLMLVERDPANAAAEYGCGLRLFGISPAAQPGSANAARMPRHESLAPEGQLACNEPTVSAGQGE
jgi:hypothetical protein